jgi:RNA polymerase sigma factor (sigma-70 family)
MTQEDIVGQARVQLLDRLVAQFAEAAYHWARLILDDEDKAYDAVQEAWLNAYLHLDQLRESAAFPGWFRQIVLHTCYRTLRGEKSSIPLSEQLPQEREADPSEEVENKERLERIREAVLALPEGERAVTELFYFGDYSQQEIAERLALPVTTVKKRLQYARRRLKESIQPDFVALLSLLAFEDATGDPLSLDPEPLMEWSPVGMALANLAESAHSPITELFFAQTGAGIRRR